MGEFMKNFSESNLARASEFLTYEPKSGDFIRLKASNNRNKVGEVAGSVNREGYVRITIFGMGFQAHRLAFYFMTGKLPPDDMEVDHINGVRNDNSWNNLRLVSHAINMQNSRKPERNTSGCQGVSQNPRNEKWVARISLNGKSIFLGEFREKSDAIQCYLEGKKKFHPGYIEFEGKTAVRQHNQSSGCEQRGLHSRGEYVKYR